MEKAEEKDSRLSLLAEAIYKTDAQINGMDGLQKRPALWRSMDGFPISDRFGSIRNADGQVYSYMPKARLDAQKDVGFASMLAINVLEQPYDGLPDSFKRECEQRAGSVLRLMDNSSSFYKLFLESTSSRMDIPDTVYQKDIDRCIQTLQTDDEHTFKSARPTLNAEDQRRQYLVELTAAVEWLKQERAKTQPELAVGDAMADLARQDTDGLCLEAADSLSEYVKAQNGPVEMQADGFALTIAPEPEKEEEETSALESSQQEMPEQKEELFVGNEPEKKGRNDFKGVVITVNGERVKTKEELLGALDGHQYEFLQECNKFLMDHQKDHPIGFSCRPITSHCKNEIVREMVNCSIDSGAATGKYWEENKAEPEKEQKEESLSEEGKPKELQTAAPKQETELKQEPEEKQAEEETPDKEAGKQEPERKEPEAGLMQTDQPKRQAQEKAEIKKAGREQPSKETSLGNATAVFYQVKHRVLDNQSRASESFYLPMKEEEILKEQMQAIQSGEELPEKRSAHLVKMSRFTGKDGREYTNYELDGKHAEEEDLIMLLSENPSCREVMVEQSKTVEHARTHRDVQRTAKTFSTRER